MGNGGFMVCVCVCVFEMGYPHNCSHCMPLYRENDDKPV